jgi:hypothetical protein
MQSPTTFLNLFAKLITIFGFIFAGLALPLIVISMNFQPSTIRYGMLIGLLSVPLLVGGDLLKLLIAIYEELRVIRRKLENQT